MPNPERYRRIKEAVGAAQVARDHGRETKDGGQGREKSLCPFHDDHDPSLVLFPDGGYKCFACGASGDSVSLEERLGRHASASEAASELEERYGLRTPAPSRNGAREKKRVKDAVLKEEVVRWVIRDVDGEPRALHIRYRTEDAEGNEGKDYSLLNPDGSYEPGAIRAKELPLYLSELVKGFDPEEPVVVAEGEQAGEAAREAGFQSVATAAGTNVVPEPACLEVLRDFAVVLWPDNDAPGKKHMAAVAEALRGIAAEVRWFEWAEAPYKGDAADHPAVLSGDAKALFALELELFGAPLYDPARHQPKDHLEGAGRQISGAQPKAGGLPPPVQINARQMRDVSEETLGALLLANEPPRLFERGGGPARVVADERGVPAIQALGENEVKHDMARAANFFKLNAKGDPVDASPPGSVAKDILAMPKRPFPPLAGVVETPFLRPDGTICDLPGYDEQTGFYLSPSPGFSMPPVPESPSDPDIAGALELLMETVGEFPYDSEGSRANALALLLTPVLRQATGGPAPLLLIEKPQAGTGGSLLAEVASVLATGRPAEMLGAPDADEEWRKQITAKLLAGAAMITIDNIDGPLYAPSLARALTARTWSDRVLGLSRSVSLAQNATWVATGNNIVLRGDLPRRCVSIRIDARTSRPWQRRGFRHPRLVAWVEENRGELVRALLVLARGWVAAGRPAAPGLTKLGNYEAWSETVGGVLAHAGVPGFLSNLDALYRKAARDDAEWEAFYSAWSDALGANATTVGALTDEIERDDDLRASVPPYLAEALERNRGSFVRKLGNALSKNEGKRYGDDDLHVVRAGEVRRAATWKLERGPASCELTSLVSFYNPDAEKTEAEEEETESRRGETNSRNSLTHTSPDEDSETATGETGSADGELAPRERLRLRVAERHRRRERRDPQETP